MAATSVLRPKWIVLIGLVVILLLWILGTYNGMIRAKAAMDESWAQVETQYQRRFDLIPNLEAVVSGAADFERETFESVTRARSQWSESQTQFDKMAALNSFDSALSRLLLVVENYPDLKATQAFRDFLVQLEGTENRIAVARKDYNAQVRQYNVYITIFPRNLFAGLFGFEPAAFFAAEEQAAQAPRVEF